MLFSRVKKLNFRIRSTFYCLIVDFFALNYVWQKISEREGFNKILKESIKYAQLSNQQVTIQLKDQLFTNLQASFKLIAGAYIVFHLIMYLGFLFEKKFAMTYLKILSLSGVIMVSLFVVSLITQQHYGDLVYGGFALLYLYVYLGLRSYTQMLG